MNVKEECEDECENECEEEGKDECENEYQDECEESVRRRVRRSWGLGPLLQSWMFGRGQMELATKFRAGGRD